ncbi:unnamed protein product [Urochloa decumbens]|uniref:DUF1618 domain-containing protein n=1 Tax=Urochloa decumbens TaxID=240449 RepID=A0ABC9B9L9_9POAL
MEVQLTQSPMASPAAAYPPWVLLSPSGDCETKQGSYSDADTNTLATAHASSGHLIGISLRLVPPAPESRVRVHFPYGVKPSSATVVLAHDDSVLVNIGFGHETQRGYTDDYFVYSAGAAAADPPRPPSLSLLPKCYRTEHEPVERMLYQYHNSIGLLRYGDDHDFVVAALEIVSSDEYDELGQPTWTAPELVLLRSGKWVVKRPAISHSGEDEDGEHMSASMSGWRWNFNSTVHAGDGSLLCWVDLSHGLLLSDVLEETPKLRYVPLPKTPSPVICRNVCATAAGTVRFVNVSPRCCCGAEGITVCHRSRHAYTINTWTLKMDADMVWVMDGVVDATELWALDAYKDLPRVRLDYPVVSLDDPNVIFFVVCDWAEWLIMVDMRSKALLSVYRYPKSQGHDRYVRPLLPSRVSDYFNSYPSRNNGMSPTSKAAADMETAMVNLKKEQLIITDGCSNSVRRQSSTISPAVPNVAFPVAAILLALQDIPGLAREDMLKAYSILVHDSNSNGCRLRALLALRMSLRKDWLLMEIKASEACSTCYACRTNM